ncbi:sialidase family protein [Chitinophaga rhizosphaerae]|uniref:sialidase family protein n=1 Tax=Chitinophaga rhizosphaerae TaxID=1864947 RepID=UPI000F80F304|nr:sialidase family protein [Chitinophaga rhizosphaerae]
MIKAYFLFIVLALAGWKTQAQTFTPVFTGGQEGHKSYRIPAIISAGGKLLAFCEGRVDHAGDFGDINIVLKESKDGGKTWGPLRTVVDYNNLQAGNPAPVADLTDPAFPQGRIFLFYNTGDNHEGEVRKGKGLREVWYKTSTDGGVTWSDAVNITTQVHRPNMPGKNPAYNFPEDWRSYANTPGHALQFADGKFKGRIYVSANHSAGKPQPGFRDYKAHGYYSDDHGKTFHLSETVTFPGGNEAMAAQLKGNRMVMNIRNQQGNERYRIIAESSDGGQSWDSTYFDRQLPDPVCQGSVLSVGNARNRRLIVCNNADTAQRNNLVLRVSRNDGKSYYKNIPIANRPDNPRRNSHTAYSDLVENGRRRVGVLFEYDDYKQIVFTTISY